MFRPQLNELPYKTRQINRPLNGGLNTGFGFDIGDNQFTEVKNIQSKYLPQVRTRFPRTSVGAKLTGPIRHLGKIAGDSITVVDDLDYKNYSGGSWVTIGTLTAAANATSVDFQGITLIANGTDRKSYDGITLADVTEMPNIDLLEVFSGRVFGASTSGYSLYFSAIATYDDWTTANDSGEIEVITREGGFCTGLKNFNNHVVFFKENSIHELYGTGPRNFFMQTLSDQIGCISPRSIVEVDGILYFWGNEGCYKYGGGTAPATISYPFITDYVDRIDKDRAFEICAGTDGKRLYFNIPIDVDDYALIVYDTDTGIWLAEDDISLVEYIPFNNVLYSITKDGQLTNMIDESGTYDYDWFFITKAYDHKSISSKKSIKQVHVVAQLSEGATMAVSVSESASGDDFVEIGTLSGDITLKSRAYLVPASFQNRADWNRIKISGTGNATIHNIECQVRIIPNNF